MATQRSITPPDPILVVGGTGKTGRRVAERLRARGSEVRIGAPRAAPPFDRDGATCRLETSDPANVAFYERFGFEVVEGGVPGAPVLTAMRRPPRARRRTHQGG
jgi:uncharacterized protein YbjT (DUF2867 family)